MPEPHERGPDDAIDRYLDGLLDDDERRRTEALVDADPALRRCAELQRRIDAALRDRLAPPVEVRVALPARRRLATRPWRFLAIAAVVALAASLLLLLGRSPSRPPVPETPPFAGTPPDRLFADVVASGFVPSEPCEDEADFRRWIDEQFDLAVGLRFDAPGVDVLGWWYEPRGVVTNDTAVLLARVDGDPALLLIDRAADVEGPRTLPAEAGVELHERRLGAIVAWEVTSDPRPGLLDLLYDPS